MIEFIFKESKKRKTIGISIHPDGTVTVSAPYGMSYEKVRQLVVEKNDWIMKHQRNFLENKSMEKKRGSLDGERHYFLGNKYELRIVENYNNNLVDIDDKYINVYIRGKEVTSNKVREVLEKWFSSKAETIIRERVLIYSKELNLKVTDIKITNVKSYWGNCNRQGVLRFNWRLVQASEDVIDYVVIHELCHLKHFNHSDRFWCMVGNIMPDYKQKKQRLKELGREISYK